MTFGGASTQLQRPPATAGGQDTDVSNSFLPVAFNLAICGAGVLGALVLDMGGDRLLPLSMTAFVILAPTARILYPPKYRGRPVGAADRR